VWIRNVDKLICKCTWKQHFFDGLNSDPPVCTRGRFQVGTKRSGLLFRCVFHIITSIWGLQFDPTKHWRFYVHLHYILSTILNSSIQFLTKGYIIGDKNHTRLLFTLDFCTEVKTDCTFWSEGQKMMKRWLEMSINNMQMHVKTSFFPTG
jgi:hypothetical protein